MDITLLYVLIDKHSAACSTSHAMDITLLHVLTGNKRNSYDDDDDNDDDDDGDD